VQHVAALTIENSDNYFIGIGLHRLEGELAFEPEILELLNLLQPHFKRAFRIQREIMDLREMNSRLDASLSRMLLGVIVLDEQGNIALVNDTAKRLTELHPALKIGDYEVKASDTEENKQLQEAIHYAMNVDAKAAHTVSSAHALHHPSRNTPLAVMIHPIETPFVPDMIVNISNFTLPEEGVLIYLSDPETSQAISTESLIQAYALTPKESVVAVGIANGLTINAIAESQHTSEKTVQTQVKAVFKKCGVSRQQELIKLLISSAYNTTG